MQRNGLLVLAKIPGLLEHIDGHSIDEVHFYSTVEEDKGLLGVSDHPRQSAANDGLGMMVCPRAKLQRRLATFAEAAGVQIKWGHGLETLEQCGDNVSLTFANGVKETVDFVIGCDGLRSQTRGCLFGEQPAEYTGLSSVCGRSTSFVLCAINFVVGRNFSRTRHVQRQARSCRHLRERRACASHPSRRLTDDVGVGTTNPYAVQCLTGSPE